MNHHRAAGKVYQKDLSARDCLNPPAGNKWDKNCQTPEHIRIFTNTDAGRPKVGEIRTHWGKGFDEKVEKNLTHGVVTQKSVLAKDLMNPAMRNLYLDVKLADAESIYKSKQVAPLGNVSKPIAPVPEKYRDTAFGCRTLHCENAGETVNPPKKAELVEREDREGHDLYKKTHNDYFVGEQINRNYCGNWNQDNKRIFGIQTPHDNDGRQVSCSLRWPNPDIGECADRFGTRVPGAKKGKTKLVSDRLDAFRERTQPVLGKVHDPIKSTVGITEAFGLSLRGDGCGAGDIIHGRDKMDFLLGKDRQRGVLAAIRHHLKKANYHNFSSLREAFSYYDKNNNNQIGINELRRVCFEFNLPIEDDTMQSLMAMCTEKDQNKIKYLEFVNLLNWKDKMPLDSQLEDVDEKVIRQIDRDCDQVTSSSLINATVGGMKTDTWQTFGVPTVRSDIPAPSIRRVSDRTNYGDELDAHGLLSPSIFTTRGVFEQDFFEPRDKATIRRLFTNIGVRMPDASWEICWDKALECQQQYYNEKCTSKSGKQGNSNKVSVECFRLVLDSITADSCGSSA